MRRPRRPARSLRRRSGHRHRHDRQSLRRQPGDQLSARPRPHAHRLHHRTAALSTGRGRYDGMLEAMAARGLTPDPRHVRSGEFREDVAYSAARGCSSASANRPTALYVANGVMALGVMRAVIDLGLALSGGYLDRLDRQHCRDWRPQATADAHRASGRRNDQRGAAHAGRSDKASGSRDRPEYHVQAGTGRRRQLRVPSLANALRRSRKISPEPSFRRSALGQQTTISREPTDVQVAPGAEVDASLALCSRQEGSARGASSMTERGGRNLLRREHKARSRDVASSTLIEINFGDCLVARERSGRISNWRLKMTTRRQFIGAFPAAGAAFAVGGPLIFDEGMARAAEAPAPHAGHFHPKGKAPSKFTLEVLERAKTALPFADRRDFEEQKKGLIAPMPDMKIMADAGHVAWDMERFQFLDQQDEFDSIHPSLHRQSRLNNNYGLYEVIPGIYQVRGFRSVRHFLRPRQDRLDRLRSVGFRRAGARRVEALPGACRRRASHQRRDLFPHAWRPLGWRARHRRGSGCPIGKSGGHRSRSISWTSRSRKTSTPAMP